MKPKILAPILALLLLVASAFPISDFELQTQSGQLWPHIVAYGDARAAAAAAAAKAETVAIAEKLKAAFDEGDNSKRDEAVTELEIAKVPEKTKRLAEIDEQLAKLAAEKAVLEAKAATPKAQP